MFGIFKSSGQKEVARKLIFNPSQGGLFLCKQKGYRSRSSLFGKLAPAAYSAVKYINTYPYF